MVDDPHSGPSDSSDSGGSGSDSDNLAKFMISLNSVILAQPSMKIECSKDTFWRTESLEDRQVVAELLDSMEKERIISKATRDEVSFGLSDILQTLKATPNVIDVQLALIEALFSLLLIGTTAEGLFVTTRRWEYLHLRMLAARHILDAKVKTLEVADLI